MNCNPLVTVYNKCCNPAVTNYVGYNVRHNARVILEEIRVLCGVKYMVLFLGVLM